MGIGIGIGVGIPYIVIGSPQDALSRFGSNLRSSLISRSVQTSGSNITGAVDITSLGIPWTTVGTMTLTASDPLSGGQDTPTIVGATTGSRMTRAYDRVTGPATSPYWRWAIVRYNSWVSGQRMIANGAASSNAHGLVHSTGSPGLAGVNSSGGNPSYGLEPQVWGLIVQQFAGATTLTSRQQDWISCRGLIQAGTNWGGATARVGESIGNGANFQMKEYGSVEGVSTAEDIEWLNNYCAYWYGPNVVRVPLNNDNHVIVFDTQSNGESQGVTDSVGPGFTFTTPLSVLTRTSPTADRNTSPTLLRSYRSRIVTAPIGKYGYELQMMIDLKTESKEPCVLIKNSFGSSSLLDALSSPIYPLIQAHYSEFSGELNNITKLYLVVDRGNTDATQGISQATARSRYNSLFADRIALMKAQCPSLANSGIYIVSVEISIDPAIVSATAAVNAGRLEALDDQAALGYNTINITTSDMSPASAPHWNSAQNNTVGSRIATQISANW